MALWKISSKSKWTWGKGKMLEKGMFIEMTGGSATRPVDYYRKMMSEHVDKVMASQY